MIILTAAQATQVRGISPIDATSALDPIPLKDGTFALPDEVIDDPAHGDVKALLQSCPKGSVAKANTYSSAQPGDTAAAAKAKMAADATALAAKGVPNYRSITRTDPRPKPPKGEDTSARMMKDMADAPPPPAPPSPPGSPVPLTNMDAVLRPVDKGVPSGKDAAIEEAQPQEKP